MVQEFAASAVGALLALLPITNPVGAVPIFYSLTADLPAREQQRQARLTAVWSVGVLLLFLITGRLILEFFGISLGVLRVAGGLLVGGTAWELVNVRQRLTPPENQEAISKADVYLVPMAIPIISGPGAIGIIMGLASSSQHWSQYLGTLVGILLVGMALYICLTSGRPLITALGTNGVGAFNRVLGFFILAIAVQMVVDGSFSVLAAYLPDLFSGPTTAA